MTCKKCPSCGNGASTSKTLDSVEMILCKVFCETRKEYCEALKAGKKSPKPSELAKHKMRSPAIQSRMNKALASKFPKGATAMAERQLTTLWKGKVPASWNRYALAGKDLLRVLDKMRNQIQRELAEKAAKVAGQKLAKKASKLWLKAIPFVNVISTAYDIYDLGKTGYDFYKLAKAELAKLNGTVFQVFPDVSITTADGKVHHIYDFNLTETHGSRVNRKFINKPQVGNRLQSIKNSAPVDSGNLGDVG